MQTNHQNLFELLKKLISIPTVSGYESRRIKDAAALAASESRGFWQEWELLPSGSILLSHKSGISGAKKLVFDAHIDTVGFAVSEVLDGGFLRVVNIGGIDPLILPSSPVLIYGKETVRGFFTSVPPHLSHGADKSNLKVSDLFVDTGYKKEELLKIVEVGTPIGFCCEPALLGEDVITSPGLDDKACVGAVLRAAQLLSDKDVEVDVYAHLAVGEEKTQLGAKTLPYALTDADACIVLDVNFAFTEGVRRFESLIMGDGAGVSYSATIKRALTDFIVNTAKKYGIPCQSVVEMTSTGTNATFIQKNGIPCAVLSIPLKNMHTYCECVSLSDVENCARLLEKTVLDYPSLKDGAVNLKEA